MEFVTLQELAQDARRRAYAVPSFCVWNAESMETVLRVADRMRSPVILMSGPGEFPLLRPAAMATLARALKPHYRIPAALHLDHAYTVELVRECLEARYTSVMLDFSGKSIEENIRGMQEVVRLAAPLGITVEGEIGTIGRDDEISTEGAKASVFTDPAQAQRFVAETGLDLLAVSIGNVHGAYRGEPNLNFCLLEEIRGRVGVPLVLHGGSGIPAEQLRKGIALGIVKVNVATELVNTVREALRGQWQAGRNLWIPLSLAEALQEMEKVIEKWIVSAGSNGKA